ncbi:four-helix bundle copper-binding protein [Peribacillus sp. AS_2]|uniref:four-helix bundle copper-binding protein n=1 Tax=Peribacillus sp. AS_2 TaxID=2996755 RepID=UPI0022A77C99|nr:four-helix bundle copper-binding protein [Peribacillus sp. AS_2]MCZ0872800.1 four-helix bundle copper-binding protein [Peribacillus sp. AS_2]
MIVRACNHCYDTCLKEEHVNMMLESIRLDREYADICSFLAQAIGRGTPLAKVCVKICESCGNECKKHDHEQCQKCAEACL